LSIVRSLAESQGGALRLRNGSYAGLCATVVLPLAMV
jgi:signal transduction histidine kinase